MFKRCTDAPDLEEISASLSPCCPHIHSLLFLFYLLCLVLILCAFSPNIMRLHSSVPLLFLCTSTSSKGNVAHKVFTSISCTFMQHHRPPQGLLLWVYASPLGLANSKQKQDEDIKCALTFTICVMIFKLLGLGLSLGPQPLPHLSKRRSQKQLRSVAYTLGRADGILSLLRLAWAERSGL